MNLLDTLNDDMKTAMKAGDKLRLSTLRMLVSAVRYAIIDDRTSPTSSQSGGQVTDDKVVEVLQREAKKRRESIEAYTLAGRTEAATQEKQELLIIDAYLPTIMGEDQVRAKVGEIMAKNTYSNFGMAMNGVMAEMKGSADGGTVAKIVKELYQ